MTLKHLRMGKKSTRRLLYGKAKSYAKQFAPASFKFQASKRASIILCRKNGVSYFHDVCCFVFFFSFFLSTSNFACSPPGSSSCGRVRCRSLPRQGQACQAKRSQMCKQAKPRLSQKSRAMLNALCSIVGPSRRGTDQKKQVNVNCSNRYADSRPKVDMGSCWTVAWSRR